MSYYNTPHNRNIEMQNVLNTSIPECIEELNNEAEKQKSIFRFDYVIVPLSDIEKNLVQMTFNASWSSARAALTKFDIYITRNFEDSTEKLLCSIYQPFAPTYQQEKNNTVYF